MRPTPTTERPGLERSASKHALPDYEVVVIDACTAIPIERKQIVPEVPAPDHELFNAEHHTPDGSAAQPHEHRYIPLLIATLAILGLLIVGVSLFVVGGIEAATVGMVWVLAGYAVAWIVVWGAGLARTTEERHLEERIQAQHKHEAINH